MNENLRAFVESAKLPEVTNHGQSHTAQVTMPSPSAMSNSLRMQLLTERIILSVSKMLELVKEVRAQALIHDYESAKKETKLRNDEIKKENQVQSVRLMEKLNEAERLEQQALSILQTFGLPK